jgi:hypothetical protein
MHVTLLWSVTIKKWHSMVPAGNLETERSAARGYGERRMPLKRRGRERIPVIVKRPATQETEREIPEEQMNEDTVKNV